MPSVDYVRPEVTELNRRYTYVEDTLAGQEVIKGKKTTYLPQPNADDTSEENKARYELYLERAVFYNVVKRTLLGLVGLVFTKDTAINIPDGLQILLTDADGSGVSIEQQARKSLSTVLAFGRAGVLTDFPVTRNEDGSAREFTIAQQEERRLFPTIQTYDHRAIINWRHERVGSRNRLSLVVLKERFIKEDDGFRQVFDDRFRVLRFNDQGQYIVQIFNDGQFNEPADTSIPLDNSGQPLSEIPFQFIGAENNEADPDDPVLYDMAVLNIGHYRNSADYEEMSFIAGQPTTVIAGLDTNWVKNVLQGEVTLGVRGVLPLPVGGTSELLQIEPNSVPKEAMDHKENQMLALGAQLVEAAKIERTATDASNEFETNTSVLGTAANNVSAAYRKALEVAAVFVGDERVVNANGEEIELQFQLNTEFGLDTLTPDERRQLVEEWQKGAITYSEMRERLRQSGIAHLSDIDAKDEIESDTIRNQTMGLDENGEIMRDPNRVPPEDNEDESDDE